MPDDSDKLNYLEGMGAFQNARMRAFWHDVVSFLRGKPAELLSFDDIRARLRLREENYRGMQDIPIDHIAGSVGRYNEFTNNYLPRSGKTQERWSRVYAVATGMQGLPPIEVYKVGEVYFVRDGNHRVSVARQLGSESIQAHVTELPTSVQLRPGMSEEELDDEVAYAAFLDETRLPYTRPHHVSLKLSETSRYGDLLGHVYLHRSIMQQAQKETIAIEDAAANWYDEVFRPAVTLMRKYNVLAESKDRTEADMYLWLIEHLSEVKELYGDKAPTRSFSDALVDFLVSRSMDVPKELLAEKDATVKLARANLDEQLAKVRAEHQNGTNGTGDFTAE
jgi:uncharacterized ParB-like nuclease family protein